MSARRRKPPAWKRWLGAAGAFFLGAVLLVAAWAKALDPEAFAEQIRLEGLEWGLSAAALAVLFVAVEAGLGTALVLGVRRLGVLAPAAAMVALFVFLTARTYWRFEQGLIDETSACGCFGNLVSRTPEEALKQDLLLLVPPLALAFLGRSAGRWPGRRLAVALVAAAAFGLLAWQAPGLPLDDLATRLKPGAQVRAFCAGAESEGSTRVCLDALAPELEVGEHLVVISDLGNEALEAAMPELNALAGRPGGPRLWLLTPSGEEERRLFFWRAGPAFEIRETPPALLRSLYRKLPRSFRVEDGRVTETWPGLPPPATEPPPAEK